MDVSILPRTKTLVKNTTITSGNRVAHILYVTQEAILNKRSQFPPYLLW